MANFQNALESGRFLVTAELTPPKGVDLSTLLAKAESLRDAVDAFNLTDSHTARMSMAPLGAGRALVERGIEPIVQMTGRDRNRIALQGDLLAAASLGVSTVLCMSGDDPTAGDHVDAKPVFDLDGIGLLKAVSALARGEDLGGSTLIDSPHLCAGATADPGASDLDRELSRIEQKLEAGAQFFQTQPVFDIARFEKFSVAVERLGAKILAGVMPLKSAKMARNMNENVFGISIPDELIDEMEKSSNAKAQSVEVTGRIVKELRSLCRGVHVMAIGWESLIPEILKTAGLDVQRRKA